MLKDQLLAYSNAVVSGEIVAGRKHIWACQRFLRDIEREGSDDFPYIFDEDKGERFLDWFRLFKHRKGVLAGQHIEPHIVQAFVYGNIYGWIHRETTYRRFKKFYFQVARKNAKTQGEAIQALYEASAFGEPAAEVLCAATKREKAKLVWDEADKLSRQPEFLKGKFKTAYSTITHILSESTIKTLSKDDRRDGDGDNPQCGIVDEYHAHDTTEIYDVIETGMGARPQPIMGTITTAGLNLDHPCYIIEYRYVAQILDPANPVENEEYFALVCELDTDDQGELIDDITDERNWPKANPIVCSYPEGIAKIRQELREALDVPEKMRNFLTKRMNVWVNAKPGGYMDLAKWKLCGVEEMPDLSGCECNVGLDLSSKIDLTSVSFELKVPFDRQPAHPCPLMNALVELTQGYRPPTKYAVFSHSFMPEDTLKAKRHTDKVPYDLWVSQGWITATPGAVVDYRFVSQKMKDIAEENGWIIKEICYDPYNATQTATELAEVDGYECVEIRQGVKTLSEPSKSLREEVYSGNVLHNNNPVLTWAIGNAVTRQDHNKNIQLDKDKSVQRIDPIAALINAHVRSIVLDETSVYDDRPEGEKIFSV